MKRGKPQIVVMFEVDANGILHVSAEEKSSGTSQQVLSSLLACVLIVCAAQQTGGDQQRSPRVDRGAD